MDTMTKDSLGDRMKSYENCTRANLPARTYTLMRFDGKAFHTFTRGCARPFDEALRRCMDAAALAVCSEATGCVLGYLQSDEITIVLTDFESLTTEAYFNGNIQKMCSVLASVVSNAFNTQWQLEMLQASIDVTDPRGKPYLPLDKVREIITCKKAMFDARAWTLSDPWEVFNTFKWRQDDATRNAIQMVAQSMFPTQKVAAKALHGKDQNAMQEIIFQHGHNFNDYPTQFKRGSFLSKEAHGWVVDTESPIINRDRGYIFRRLPLLAQPSVQQYTTNEG